jgi:glycosyltransferase involved in cell wall biosynthesis
MRILLISHAYVAKENLRKPELLAGYPNLEIGIVTPRRWRTAYLSSETPARWTGPGRRLSPLPIFFSDDAGKYFYEPLGLVKVVRNFRPDIIHLEEEPWTPVALEVAVISMLSRVKLLIFTWENLDLQLSFWQRAIERFVFNTASLVLAGNSEAGERVHRRGFKRPVEVLPQFGVNTEHFKPMDILSSGFVVGFVGRLVEEKGIKTLLEAVAKLPTDVKLLLVSSSPKLPDEFVAFARKLKIYDRIRVVCRVPHHDLPKYINQMDVFVLPSETTPTWKEQFGRLLIEVMACKIPVIGSSSGAIPEVIDNAGLIFEEGNVDALASKIESLRSNENLRLDLAEKGYQRILENFTFEKIAERTVEIYVACQTSIEIVR